MTGGSDYLLRVEVETAGDFERIHKDILSTLPGVLQQSIRVFRSATFSRPDPSAARWRVRPEIQKFILKRREDGG